MLTFFLAAGGYWYGDKEDKKYEYSAAGIIVGTLVSYALWEYWGKANSY